MRQLDLDYEISTQQISADEKKVPSQRVVVALLAAKLDAGKSRSAESGLFEKTPTFELVGGLEHFYFPIQLGMSSSQLTIGKEPTSES